MFAHNGDITGGVQAITGGIWNTVSAGHDITGAITSAGDIGTISLDQWSGLNAGPVPNGVVLMGSGGVRAGGSINSTITAQRDIEALTAKDGISGSATAGRHIGPVYVYGSLSQTADMSATLTSGGHIGVVSAENGSVTGTLTASGHVNGVYAAKSYASR